MDGIKRMVIQLVDSRGKSHCWLKRGQRKYVKHITRPSCTKASLVSNPRPKEIWLFQIYQICEEQSFYRQRVDKSEVCDDITS
ncbi:unnamed protein product [Sphenostylis stenocarpa]|uniref:Uncharacterized protein n=1 Tax=Sphenostylis stenocarpa TaxID=92480 RepID=A0AA86S410_9FABA|nr:unnamed protein product [Sphenostylis stenocarpa]